MASPDARIIIAAWSRYRSARLPTVDVVDNWIRCYGRRDVLAVVEQIGAGGARLTETAVEAYLRADWVSRRVCA